MHIPSSDGCGSLGMKIDTEYLPAAEMATCCDTHDICYDTCNSDKELCDLDFKRCLYKYCDSFERSLAGDILIKGCKSAAKTLFVSSMTLGCKSYLDSQEKACFCPTNAGSQNQGKYEKEKYKKQKDKKNNWRTEM